MTAPFSTDAAEVVTNARRLRSDPGATYDVNFAVGHGFAAHIVGLPGATADKVDLLQSSLKMPVEITGFRPTSARSR